MTSQTNVLMSVRIASDRRQRRRRRLTPIFYLLILCIIATMSVITEALTPQIEIAQESDDKSAITGDVDVFTKPKRKKIDYLGFPQPAKTYFEGGARRITLDGLLSQNPRLKSLDMFQHDEDGTLIDITSPNLDREDARNSEMKIDGVIQERLVQMSSAPKGHLHTAEGLQRTYDTLLPKITQSKVDNFDELYRFFNSTYFHLARHENATKDPMPYPSYNEMRMAGAASHRLRHNKSNRSTTKKGFMHRLHSAKTERISMHDDNDHVPKKEKNQDDVKVPAIGIMSANRFSPLNEKSDEWQKKDFDSGANATAPRRFAPRSPIGDNVERNKTANGEVSGMKMTIEQNGTRKSETTSFRPLTMTTFATTTTTYFAAVRDDMSDENDRMNLKWQLGNRNKIITSTETTDNFDTKKVTSIQSSTSPITTITLAPSMSIVEYNATERQDIKVTDATPILVETSTPERLEPFPPIMPGGQFYVDQHISYGKFGRYVASRNNVVYDPNILQSRYGFNGILMGTFDSRPPGSGDSDPASHTPFSELPDGALVSQFGDLSLANPNPFSTTVFSTELSPENNENSPKPKSITFGVQNLPAVTHQLVPISDGDLTDHPIIFNHGPTIFSIPLPPKLELAKAVPVRLKSFSSVTVGNLTQINTLVRSSYEESKSEKSVGKLNGLLADNNITDSRRKILLDRLNTAVPSSDDAGSRNAGTVLFSGGNSGDRTLIVRVVPDAAGNTLNWRPVSAKSNLNALPRTPTLAPPSIHLVPLSQFIPALRQVEAPKSLIDGDIESISTFDVKATPQCYATDHLSDSNDNNLAHVSTRLVPAVQKCFRRAKNCVLQEAHPLERHINFSEQQCVIFCGSHSYCISITYSPAMQICNIFNVRNGTGAARLYQHQDFRYYELRRKTTSHDEEESSQHDDCWKENAPFISVDNPPGLLIDSHEATTTQPNDPPNKVHQSSVIFPIDNDFTLSSVPKDTCSGERDIIVFKSPGYRLLNSKDHVSTGPNESDNKMSVTSMHLDKPLQQLSSETECIFSCLINLAHGTTPYECMAVTYNINDASCLLYSMSDNLNVNVHLVPESNHNHYEKGCITMDLVKLCKGYPIIRHAQKTLLGFAMDSRFAVSFVECLELCFADRQHAHEQNAQSLKNRRYCKSIMYFYENRESALAFFVNENETLVDYASFESCYEMHNDVEDYGIRQNADAASFAEFSDALTPYVLTNERRRSQPNYLYTVDSDTGARPIANKQRLTADRPTWQLRFPMVERSWAGKHYADSEGKQFSEDGPIHLPEPPRAKVPQVHIQRLSEMNRRQEGGNTITADRTQNFMGKVLRRSIKRIQRRR